MWRAVVPKDYYAIIFNIQYSIIFKHACVSTLFYNNKISIVSCESTFFSLDHIRVVDGTRKADFLVQGLELRGGAC